MNARWIASSSLAAGLGAIALVAAIQIDPLIFTHPVKPEVGAPSRQTRAVRRADPELDPTDSQSPRLIELPPVYIKGSPLKSKMPEPGATGSEPAVMKPCSDWREIGPATVSSGVPSGSRRVRNLC